MKRIERLLFNFNMAYYYTFVSGIFISLAVNLFTDAFLAQSLPVSVNAVHRMGLFLFLSSIGAFGVSAVLEGARGEWEAIGSPRDPEVMRDYIERNRRPCWMWFFFALIVVGLTFSLLQSAC